MRRCLAGLVLVGVLLVPAVAQAGGVRIRLDPDDTRSVLDIEQVATGRSDTGKRLFFGFATFEPFGIEDIDEGGRFQFNLDTKQLPHDDFRLYFIYWLATDELLCRLQTEGGRTIGERPVRFDGMSMFCGIPKWWLDIRERIEFNLESYDTNRHVDTAPDEGRYRGL
jgi:hypothetical protein